MSKDQPAKNPPPNEPGPDDHNAPAGLGARIVFWGLLIYALALAVMVIEDMLSHTFF